MVTNNIIRAALDLKRGGEHEVEIPHHTTLKEYFGMYVISGKAYRTYEGPNKFFGEISRILMEYPFAHTNPTSMPQNKAAIMIIREYQGERWIGEFSPAKESVRDWNPFNQVSGFYLCWPIISRYYTHLPRLPLIAPSPLRHHHQGSNERIPWP